MGASNLRVNKVLTLAILLLFRFRLIIGTDDIAWKCLMFLIFGRMVLRWQVLGCVFLLLNML